MAPWRVLGIDKCGSLRSPQPSTRHGKANREMTGKPNRKRGGADTEELEKTLAALDEAYKAADTLIRTDFAAADTKLSDSISALESAYTAADEAIWDAIEQLQSALDEKAPAGHNNAITWTTFAIAILALAAGVAALVRSS